jgi:hypothetical protein
MTAAGSNLTGIVGFGSCLIGFPPSGIRPGQALGTGAGSRDRGLRRVPTVGGISPVLGAAGKGSQLWGLCLLGSKLNCRLCLQARP